MRRAFLSALVALAAAHAASALSLSTPNMAFEISADATSTSAPVLMRMRLYMIFRPLSVACVLYHNVLARIRCSVLPDWVCFYCLFGFVRRLDMCYNTD